MAARARVESLEAQVRVRPSPAQVLALVESHGMQSAVERWGWIGRDGLGKLAQEGRDIRRARTGAFPATRRTTREQEEAVVAAVYRTGSVQAAAAETGTHYTTIMIFLRERGLRDYPRVSTKERGRRAWQTRLAAAAQAGATA